MYVLIVLILFVVVGINSSKGDNGSEKWSGKWFPEYPNSTDAQLKDITQDDPNNDRIMGIPNTNCDDAHTNLSTDFDPNNIKHQFQYMCLQSIIKPNPDLEPIETEYEINEYYTPIHLCMNETIIYSNYLPTYGTHRPLWPKYGEYTYLPPQRWLHSLEHGAIVLLYHPCANSDQVRKLKNLVKNCLYRHIITPYNKLSEKRPLALVGWKSSLEMNVIDNELAKQFIMKRGKTGPEKTSKNGQYEKLLTVAASVISDIDDIQMCKNI